MKKEDIIQAAVNYDQRFVVYKAFKAGVKWFMDNAWHEVSNELPEDGRLVLGIGKNRAFICGPNNSGFAETASHLELKQWAYVDDLKPMED